MGVIIEKEGEVEVLRWDRNNFEYVPLRLDFNHNYQQV
jgi:hypothetical protein